MELPNELHALSGDRERMECACDLVNARCVCRNRDTERQKSAKRG